jgi:hypothetical protein
VMDDDPVWHLEAPALPCPRKREVYWGRQRIRKPMERQRGLVRDDAMLIGPEPGSDEIFVVTRRKVDQSINASPRPIDSASPDVFVQVLARPGGHRGSASIQLHPSGSLSSHSSDNSDEPLARHDTCVAIPMAL